MRAPGYIILVAVVSLLVTVSCSGGSSPVQPGTNGDDHSIVTTPPPELMGDERSLLMAYDVEVDFTTLEVSMTPLRTSAAHFDIRPILSNPWFCPTKNCVKIQFLEFNTDTGYFTLRATLVNPSTIVGHDVRGIVYDNETTNHEILNPDDYTRLWAPDGYDGVYPFRAFAKSNPERAIHALASFSEIYEFQFDPLPAKWKFPYAIDCSWPSNCEEPYEISGQTQVGAFYSNHACVKLSCKVAHHAGPAHISAVTLDTTELLGEEIEMEYNLDEDSWEVVLMDEDIDLEPGNYDVRITAKSPGIQIELYDFFDIEVFPGDEVEQITGTVYDEETQLGIPLAMLTTSDGEILYTKESDYCGFISLGDVPEGSRVISLGKPGYHTTHTTSVITTEPYIFEEFLKVNYGDVPEPPVIELNDPDIDIVGGFVDISGFIFNSDCFDDQVGIYVHQGEEYLMDLDDDTGAFNQIIILTYGTNEIVVRATNASGSVLSDKIQIDYFPDWNFRVTLTWNTATDQDLHMWEPDLNEHCYWMLDNWSAHLELDIDIIPGYGPENITPISDDLPVGVYPVAVDYYSGAPPTTCVVTVRLNVGTPSETSIQFEHVLTVPDHMDNYPVEETTDSWWRVCDLVMGDDGVMTWQEADTTITLWE